MPLRRAFAAPRRRPCERGNAKPLPGARTPVLDGGGGCGGASARGHGVGKRGGCLGRFRSSLCETNAANPCKMNGTTSPRTAYPRHTLLAGAPRARPRAKRTPKTGQVVCAPSGGQSMACGPFLLPLMGPLITSFVRKSPQGISIPQSLHQVCRLEAQASSCTAPSRVVTRQATCQLNQRRGASCPLGALGQTSLLSTHKKPRYLTARRCALPCSTPMARPWL